ncbi:MAG: ATP-binding protein [Armatimonadetes bacterium]|nr:ATP-binding protein [Anaerolineae bacterium]
MSNSTVPETGFKQLRSDELAAWITTEWQPRYPGQPLNTVWVDDSVTNDEALTKLNREMAFDGYLFTGYAPVACSAVSQIENRDYEGITGGQIGAFVYHFEAEADGTTADALAICTHYSDQDAYCRVGVAAVPEPLRGAWALFAQECYRLVHSYEPVGRVVVVGGRYGSFVPTVAWDEIILPVALKADIMDDLLSFFTKGAAVYTKLNLKPFRKLLLAGVPGTGKTMLCNALAKWALARNYLVIYVSSAYKAFGAETGATFDKIQEALDVAANSRVPTLIILEELDAYLNDKEKALILNVLDGSESRMNPYGTLLISTTNYPQAIDERVLKRPGRLDRIYIIPQMRTQLDVEAMLRRYLGGLWQEAHLALVPKLVGYPGAFIREVAIYALTQVAYGDMDVLSLDMMMEAFEGLRAQIEARDDFLTQYDAPMIANGVHE